PPVLVEYRISTGTGGSKPVQISKGYEYSKKHKKTKKNSDGLLAPLLNHLRDFCYIFQLRKF
ncbi:hypothetical protein AAK979_02990, partial [Ileibacterium valens]|uniref:hypothetical protein n=1 Tax=Ileibacterium valens TaxID=1862668 RepID=UPI003510D6C9